MAHWDAVTWATIAVAVFTLLYTLFTGWVLLVSRVQLARESNPAVCARILSASVGYDPQNGCNLSVRIEVRALGGGAAVNVVVSGKLHLFATGDSPARKTPFRWATIPVLAVGENHIDTVVWPSPELGKPELDQREVPLMLEIVTGYSDITTRRYFSLLVTSPASIRTPQNEAHTWSIDLGAGVLQSRVRARTPEELRGAVREWSHARRINLGLRKPPEGVL